MPVENEMGIIKRVLSGEKEAFEELVVHNQKNVYNLALKLTCNEEDALDISQEAFFKAYTRLADFRGESKFSVWMYRLTYNLCMDFLRKKQRHNTVSLTNSDSCDDNSEIEIPDARESPEHAVLRRETRNTIVESINELGDIHREILVMREVTGMSYDDIAATLGISEGTVKSRLARARKSLADILISKGTFPDGFRLKREEVEEHG